MKISTPAVDLEARGHLFKVPANAQIYERSISVALTYDKLRDGRGLTFSLAPTIGCPRASVEAQLFGTERLRTHAHSQDSCNDNKALETTLGHKSYVLDERVMFAPRITLQTTGYGTKQSSLGIRFEYESLRELKGTLDVQVGVSDYMQQRSHPELLATGTIFF